MVKAMGVDIDGQSDIEVSASGALKLEAHSTSSLSGSTVFVGCSAGGSPVARVGDSTAVGGGAGTIVSGSSTVRAC